MVFHMDGIIISLSYDDVDDGSFYKVYYWLRTISLMRMRARV